MCHATHVSSKQNLHRKSAGNLDSTALSCISRQKLARGLGAVPDEFLHQRPLADELCSGLHPVTLRDASTGSQYPFGGNASVKGRDTTTGSGLTGTTRTSRFLLPKHDHLRALSLHYTGKSARAGYIQSTLRSRGRDMYQRALAFDHSTLFGRIRRLLELTLVGYQSFAKPEYGYAVELKPFRAMHCPDPDP